LGVFLDFQQSISIFGHEFPVALDLHLLPGFPPFHCPEQDSSDSRSLTCEEQSPALVNVSMLPKEVTRHKMSDSLCIIAYWGRLPAPSSPQPSFPCLFCSLFVSFAHSFPGHVSSPCPFRILGRQRGIFALAARDHSFAQISISSKTSAMALKARPLARLKGKTEKHLPTFG
jgi:hypothetical protein